MALCLTVRHAGRCRSLRIERQLVTLGRSVGNSISIPDEALSRSHCQFEVQDGEVFVRDLNSRNGTWVRGRAATRRRLDRGEVVRIGHSEVVFEGLESAPSGPLAQAFKTLPLAPAARATARRSLSEENRGLRQLLDITRQIVAELDEDRVLASIIDIAVDLSGAERGFVVLFSGDDLEVEVARSFWRADLDDPQDQVSRAIVRRVRDERCALIVEDAADDERFEPFYSVHALKLRSVFCLPLIFKDELVGVLYLDNRFAGGSFKLSESEVFETFADLAAIALHNSGRIREAEARIVSQGPGELRAGERETPEEAAATQKEGLRYGYEGLILHSPAMKEMIRCVDRVIPTDLPVLLEGEVGTGKESVARLLHDLGPRSRGPFLFLSCAALPPSLAEVELFGHGPGAYTGAGEGRDGLLAQAEGGTLYLSGIEDTDPEIQALLLRALESGEYRRVGETETQFLDIRVVASSLRPLSESVAEGRFREDLYYRLCGMRIPVPALAERPEDLPEMIQGLMASEAPGQVLTPGARKELLARRWPGNIIELRAEIRRLGALGSAVIDAEQLAAPPGETGDLKSAVAALESRMIAQALRRHQGNRTRAAADLGLSRPGLRKKIQRLKLEEEGEW